MNPDFDNMNETDVRETIVRPWLAKLGYAHGTTAHIRTEVPLRNDKAFLGRKNSKKDPPLAGRADYVCEAVSYGRWVVEVKNPTSILTQDDVEQAHSYCAHPGISAVYFVLTNGREFRLYAVAQLEESLLTWTYSENDQHLPALINILGYEAIKKRYAIIRPDVNKPLGIGLPSRVRIVGGEVVYGEHQSFPPLAGANFIKGKIGAVSGVNANRASDGRLHATVSMISPFQQFQQINARLGLDRFEFFSADEYLSSDIAQPTILQNVVSGRLEPGWKGQVMPGMPEIVMPIGFQFEAYSEATGYMKDEDFVGSLMFDYRYRVIRGPRSGNAQLDAAFNNIPPSFQIAGDGTFKVIFKPDRN